MVDGGTSPSRSLLHSLEVVKRSPERDRVAGYAVTPTASARHRAGRCGRIVSRGLAFRSSAVTRATAWHARCSPSIEGGNSACRQTSVGRSDLDVIDQCRVSRAGGLGGGRRGPRGVRAHAPLAERPRPRGDRRHDAVPRPRGALPPLPRARHHPRQIGDEQVGQLGVKLEREIPVDEQPEKVYAFWRDLRNLPIIMPNLESVQVLVRPPLSLASEGAGRNDLRVDRGDHQRQAQRAHRVGNGARRPGRARRFRPFRSPPGRRHDRPGFPAIRPTRRRADSHADPDARRGSEQADRRRSRAAPGRVRARGARIATGSSRHRRTRSGIRRPRPRRRQSPPPTEQRPGEPRETT